MKNQTAIEYIDSLIEGWKNSNSCIEDSPNYRLIGMSEMDVEALEVAKESLKHGSKDNI